MDVTGAFSIVQAAHSFQRDDSPNDDVFQCEGVTAVPELAD